jgi:hypothetical protein
MSLREEAMGGNSQGLWPSTKQVAGGVRRSSGRRASQKVMFNSKATEKRSSRYI